jgi:hypothetical protein
MSFTVRVDSSGLRRQVGYIKETIRGELRQAANEIGSEFVRRMRVNQFAGYTGQSHADKLQVRSGELRRDVRFLIKGQDSDLILRMEVLPQEDKQTNYGVVHEYGRTIRAKRGRYMTIPVGEALTPTGQTREAWRPRRGADGKWYVNGYRSFIFTGTNGKLYIGYHRNVAKAGRVAKGAKRGVERRDTKAVWRLQSEVNLPGGRLRFHQTWAEMDEYVQARVRAAIDRSTLAPIAGGRGAPSS